MTDIPAIGIPALDGEPEPVTDDEVAERAPLTEGVQVETLERGSDATRPGVLLSVDEGGRPQQDGEVALSDPARSDPASLSDRPDRIFKETHSSGDSNDLLNTPAQRLAADPALEPELARLREEERLERAGLVRGQDGVAL